jgi:PAS domain S-box-containing protein
MSKSMRTTGLPDSVLERASNEKLLRFHQAAIDNASEAIFWIDQQSRFLYVNQAACRSLGYVRTELVEMTVADINPKVLLGGGWSEYWRQLVDETELIFETRHRRKDGTTFPVEASVHHLVFDGQGYACVSARDISARKQAEIERLRLEEARRSLEAQVQHAQKLESLGVLAGGIAHDFNNLLGGILGNAELAFARLDSASPVRSLVQEITRAADRCAELSNQMLAYSGKGKFVLERIDLGQMMREMVDLLHLSISKKALLHFELSKNLPAVEVDPTQVRQVVMNLITNASDALGEDSGHIFLRTGVQNYEPEADQHFPGPSLEAGTQVFLEVEDTGCGMDEMTRSRLFDPFFTTKLTGRGLGMAAVLGIVRAHHGTIQVESFPGEGTTFRVLFNASTSLPTVHPKRPVERAKPWRGTGTVLVVDDEEVVRVLARSILEEAGFEVLECADGRAALDLFKCHQQDIVVVLLDMTMPKLDGSETFRELRQVCPEVRVILSSGYSKQVALRRFTEHGIAGFLQKPYRPNNLLEKVQEVLADQPPVPSNIR